MKMGRRLRCSSVTSSTSLTSRRANQLATCKRQTGAGCSLLPPVRLGPPCRRPILIATKGMLFRRQDTSLLPRPGACSETNRVDQTGQTDRAVEVRRCPGRVPDVLTELRVHFGDVHGLERKIRCYRRLRWPATMKASADGFLSTPCPPASSRAPPGRRITTDLPAGPFRPSSGRRAFYLATAPPMRPAVSIIATNRSDPGRGRQPQPRQSLAHAPGRQAGTEPAASRKGLAMLIPLAPHMRLIPHGVGGWREIWPTATFSRS